MLDPRLNHVVAVARTGSFTAAAQTIGLTQSAVTKGVADLERQLGYAIFHRTARGALLTEKGSDFVERAARLLDDARALLEAPSGTTDAYAGPLRIGVCPASLEWRLIGPLANLLARHPSIRFDVSGGSFERMVQLLRNGAVDVAVGLDAAFSEWPDLRRERVPDLETTLFVRRGHPALAKVPATFADLAQHDFVAPSDSRPFSSVIRHVFESQGVEWRTRLHFIDYFPIVRRIVATSDAVGVVSYTHASTLRFQRDFELLEHLVLFDSTRMCCAVRGRWESKPAVRAFISAMQGDDTGYPWPRKEGLADHS
ncbi:MAG TPA: LysR family transcriptional regulator [Caulobacteraceae bacterium]|jgi:DNA-binding transcriptional LysR family regulator|nr:LysR family transcriptional regulator [Caulobacteraceae bacterium]